MKIKPGASMRGLRPEILLAVVAAETIWQRHHAEAVITCGTDGKHRRSSAHYTGRAVDLRSRNIAEGHRERAVEQLEEALGEEYDVVFEGQGTPHEHVHVEYDPKGAAG
jgi:hypothetical protein